MGGVKFPADFDFVANVEEVGNELSNLPDPQIVKGLVDAIVPNYHMSRTSISPANMNRDYNMTTSVSGEFSYNNIPLGGSVMGLGVKYGLGGGEDFSMEQFGVSIDSNLTADNPIGVYIFIKSGARLIYNSNGVQLQQ